MQKIQIFFFLFSFGICLAQEVPGELLAIFNRENLSAQERDKTISLWNELSSQERRNLKLKLKQKQKQFRAPASVLDSELTALSNPYEKKIEKSVNEIMLSN